MEIDTRLPLIIFIPDLAPKVVNDIVETIDIYPTLVELAGFAVPENIQGEHLLKKTRNYALLQISRDTITGLSVRNPDFYSTIFIFVGLTNNYFKLEIRVSAQERILPAI